eukprot:m.861190 g.861190  ORF g.861190 m.861190 type:complete len:174 (+) comp59685_c1_seq12:1670-2191(+)
MKAFVSSQSRAYVVQFQTAQAQLVQVLHQKRVQSVTDSQQQTADRARVAYLEAVLKDSLAHIRQISDLNARLAKERIALSQEIGELRAAERAARTLHEETAAALENAQRIRRPESAQVQRSFEPDNQVPTSSIESSSPSFMTDEDFDSAISSHLRPLDGWLRPVSFPQQPFFS